MYRLSTNVAAIPALPEGVEDELTDFKVIIDEGWLYVARANGVYVAETHSPCDLGELGWRLASAGYKIEQLVAFHDGVIEMMLRPLGDITDVPEDEIAYRTEIQNMIKEKEMAYA